MEEVEGSSRIFIQGLPPYADEKRIRQLFGKRGDVTDVKVIRTKAGHSRQFGFVGFTSTEQARDCIQYFNNSYIDTSRIQVKFAESRQSDNIARPWSKYSAGSSQYNKRHRDEEPPKLKAREAKKLKKSKYKADDNAEDDPELAEFLEVMQPRSKTALWANDGTEATAKSKMPQAVEKEPQGKEAESDDELYEELDVSKAADKQENLKSKKSRKASKKATQIAQEEDEGNLAEEEIEKDSLVADTGVSDLDYLKSRMKAKDRFQEVDESEEESEESESDISSDSEESEESESDDSSASDLESEDHTESGDGDDEESEKSEATGTHGELEEEEGLEPRRNSYSRVGTKDSNPDGPPPISETGRLFLRNLPYQATENDLKELFETYGELSEVHLVMDRLTDQKFSLEQQTPQNKRKEAADKDNDERDSGFKQQKASKSQAEAGNRQAWNTLFMRPDTVAEAIAAHFKISKAELLNRDAADLPVRMALGEAHVIALTKKGLEEGGVDISAIEQAALASGKDSKKKAGVERSSNAIIVKNLPHSATEDELQESFQKFGPIARLILPETRTVAIVQFHSDSDARQAFKSLAFRKFQMVPLFLEWAPKNVFNASAPLLSSTLAAPKKIDLSNSLDNIEVDEENATESSSIYVKNISWATTDSSLLKHFDSIISAMGGSVRAAKVSKRKDAKTGKMLSAGYGFVECSSEKVAKLAIKKLQGSMLEGHKLALQLSMKKNTESQADGKSSDDRKNARATKIVVRNVAFEAKSQDVRSVFQPFGQVKSVRVPRKFDGSHRGFAFVDFVSHKEAVGAMEAVNGVHLYGRRLVCEWASGDEDLEDLRAKTAAKFDNQA